MDPDEAPYSRRAAFGLGAGTPSLAQDSARQNSMVPRAFKPTSVLHQLYLSPQNGNSQRDAQRQLLGGGSLPTDNGSSSEAYEASRYIASKYASY